MDENPAEFQAEKILRAIKKTTFGRNEIPTYLFDSHNIAFYCWADGLKQNIITRGSTLIHIDTHFDGNYPLDTSYLNLNLANLQRVAEITNRLSIFNFIAPAQVLGLVDNVVWISPREFDEKQFEYTAVVDHKEEIITSISLKSILAKLNQPASVIVDVDIDYFMHGNTAEEDFSQVREVMNKAGLITRQRPLLGG